MKSALKSISRGGLAKGGVKGRDLPDPRRRPHAVPCTGVLEKGRGRENSNSADFHPKRANLGPISSVKTGPAEVVDCHSPKAYWTLWGSEADHHALYARFGLAKAAKSPLPHENLCSFGFSNPEELLSCLIGKGWRKSEFDNTGNRFALVKVTPAGMRVTAFETFRDAVKHHKACTTKIIN